MILEKNIPKQQIRRRVLDNISKLQEDFFTRRNANLEENLGRFLGYLKIKGYKRTLLWIPSFKSEPRIESVIDHQILSGALYAPVVRDDNQMRFVKLHSNWKETLETGPGKVKQPVFSSEHELAIDSDEPTAVVLPGLAFDHYGVRLGRGAGHYDKFLSNPKTGSWIKIGLCWSFQILSDLPAESHDIKVDWICTEQECFKTLGIK